MKFKSLGIGSILILQGDSRIVRDILHNKYVPLDVHGPRLVSQLDMNVLYSLILYYLFLTSILLYIIHRWISIKAITKCWP